MLDFDLDYNDINDNDMETQDISIEPNDYEYEEQNNAFDTPIQDDIIGIEEPLVDDFFKSSSKTDLDTNPFDVFSDNRVSDLIEDSSSTMDTDTNNFNLNEDNKVTDLIEDSDSSSEQQNEVSFLGHSREEIDGHIKHAEHEMRIQKGNMEFSQKMAASKERMGDPHSLNDHQYNVAKDKYDAAVKEYNEWINIKPDEDK